MKEGLRRGKLIVREYLAWEKRAKKGKAHGGETVGGAEPGAAGLAIRYALETAAAELTGEPKQKLKYALLLNCESGKDWPFEYLNLPGVSRSDFYRRRERFLTEVDRRTREK